MAGEDPLILLAPLKPGAKFAGEWVLDNADAKNDSDILIRTSNDRTGESLTLWLTKRDDRAPHYAQSQGFNITYISTVPGAPSETEKAALDKLVETIRSTDHGQLQLVEKADPSHLILSSPAEGEAPRFSYAPLLFLLAAAVAWVAAYRYFRARGSGWTTPIFAMLGVLIGWTAMEWLVAKNVAFESHRLSLDCPIVDTLRPARIEVDAAAERKVHVEKDTVRRSGGTFTILVLGDEFTFGAGVAPHESYPRQLGRVLQSKYGPSIKVLNAGIPGTGTAHQLAYYMQDGRRLSPDLVLLGYSDGNDAADSANSGLWLAMQGNLILLVPPQVSRRYRFCHGLTSSFLLQGSHLLTFLLNQISVRANLLQFFSASKTDPGVIALTHALIGRLAREVRADGGQLAMVRFPTLPEAGVERDMLFKASRDFSLPFLDLDSDIHQWLEQAKARDVVFLRSEGTFTPEANQTVADTIASFLAVQSLLPIRR